MSVAYIWLSVTAIWAKLPNRPLSKAICDAQSSTPKLPLAIEFRKRSNDVPVSSLLQKEPVGPALEVAHAPLAAEDAQEEEAAQIEKQAALPLAKVAHTNVMDLLSLFFVAKPISIPSYTPFVQQIGVRINWFELLGNLWPNGQKSYGGGVDLHFRGPIQLAVDLGYRSDQPKDIVYGNQFRYRSKGSYGLAALLYVMHPTHLSNAYFGIGYGQSRFDLITFCKDTLTPASNPFVAGWIKYIGGSELRLVAQWYGGMQFGVVHLLHATKNEQGRISNYTIPGYGKIVNKIMPDITLYLKWSISFLEKKIVI